MVIVCASVAFFKTRASPLRPYIGEFDEAPTGGNNTHHTQTDRWTSLKTHKQSKYQLKQNKTKQKTNKNFLL